MVCKVNVFLLMCKLFWKKIGETYRRPLQLPFVPDLLDLNKKIGQRLVGGDA